MAPLAYNTFLELNVVTPYVETIKKIENNNRK